MRWLLEGRNCFCVWLFWCSELCSVDQTVTVQRGSVLMWRVQSDTPEVHDHLHSFECVQLQVVKTAPDSQLQPPVCRGVAMGQARQAIAWGPVFWGGSRQLTFWTIGNVIINNIHATWSNISASPSLSRYAGCVFFFLVLRRPPFPNWHSTYSRIY